MSYLWFGGLLVINIATFFVIKWVFNQSIED